MISLVNQLIFESGFETFEISRSSNLN